MADKARRKPSAAGAARPARVTVVLSSYNHAPFLAEAIDSVLAQSHSDFELLVWDDASTDGSWDIIESYRQRDPRIRARRNPRNLRDAYRMALRSLPTLGDYLAIHHSDDAWEPDKLRLQLECLQARPELGAVFTRVQVVDERGAPFADSAHSYHRIFEQDNRGRHAWLRRFFLQGNCLCHPSVLMRSSAYQRAGGYRYGIAQLPDLDLWMRLCLQHEIHILDQRLTRFRVRDNEANMSGNRPETRSRMHFEWPRLMENYLKIRSVADFEAIFGIRLRAAEHIPSALAMLTLRQHPIPAVRQFGLDVLFQQLNSPDGARVLREHFNFGHAEFIQLTAAQNLGR